MATIAGDALVEPIGRTRAGAARLDAIDMLRGFVIAVMVLDHVRDFFHADAFLFDPTDPARTTPLLFLTRWVTHLCAPTFVFLSGVSIDFQRTNGKAGAALSRFLATRGLWLILLEATVVGFGFNFGPILFFQVIWAIGASMVAMAALVWLPRRFVGVIGVAAIAGVGTLVRGAPPPVVPAWVTFAIAPGLFPWGLHGVVMYPVVAWLGIMCLGYAAGPLFRLPPGRRGTAFGALGLAALVAFFLLRGLTPLGDPSPWTAQPTTARAAMSFMNISKYPPSPDYVLATLGVSSLLFVALGRLSGAARDVLLAWGRTPLFTYVLHIYLAHGLAVLLSGAAGREVADQFDLIMRPPTAGGFGLGAVYLLWALILVLLYPPARWFAAVKRRRRDWWLSYL